MRFDTSKLANEELVSKEMDSENAAIDGPMARWIGALADLVSVRMAIISAESRGAVGTVVAKLIWAVIGVLGAVFFWIALMAGLVGFIPAVTKLDWYHVAFILAGFHFFIVLLAILLIKKKTAPIFEVTKSEFIKDKQWLSTIKSTSKS